MEEEIRKKYEQLLSASGYDKGKIAVWLATPGSQAAGADPSYEVFKAGYLANEQPTDQQFKEVEKERDYFRARYEEVFKERDSLLKDQDLLSKSYNKLDAEQDDLLSQHSKLKEEHTLLKLSHDRAWYERDALEEQFNKHKKQDKIKIGIAILVFIVMLIWNLLK